MRIDRRTALLAPLAAGLVAGSSNAQLSADPVEEILLWPDGPPHMPDPPLLEEMRERSPNPEWRDRIRLDISLPRLAVIRPERPNGASALIIPGGGYSWVVVDKEGLELGHWLAARGVTAFILFYRLPHQGWATGPNTPLLDAQRAVRLIRHRATFDLLDPNRIAAIGFSAGGHACADLVARFALSAMPEVDEVDRVSARPDAAAPIYPVVSMSAPHAHPGSRRNLIGESPSPELERAHSPHLHVTAEAPPCFLLHAEDDASVPVANTLLLREALRARGVATEMHLFPDGGHGFGLRLARGRSVENWPELLFAWGRRQNLWA